MPAKDDTQSEQATTRGAKRADTKQFSTDAPGLELRRPRTREEALERGAKYFYPDNPCKHGHAAKRYAANSMCVECQSGHNRVRLNNRAEIAVRAEAVVQAFRTHRSSPQLCARVLEKVIPLARLFPKEETE